MATEFGVRISASTSSREMMSALLYTYRHLMYLRLPSMVSMRSSTVTSSRNSSCTQQLSSVKSKPSAQRLSPCLGSGSFKQSLRSRQVWDLPSCMVFNLDMWNCTDVHQGYSGLPKTRQSSTNRKLIIKAYGEIAKKYVLHSTCRTPQNATM